MARALVGSGIEDAAFEIRVWGRVWAQRGADSSGAWGQIWDFCDSKRVEQVPGANIM